MHQSQICISIVNYKEWSRQRCALRTYINQRNWISIENLTLVLYECSLQWSDVIISKFSTQMKVHVCRSNHWRNARALAWFPARRGPIGEEKMSAKWRSSIKVSIGHKLSRQMPLVNWQRLQETVSYLSTCWQDIELHQHCSGGWIYCGMRA